MNSGPLRDTADENRTKQRWLGVVAVAWMVCLALIILVDVKWFGTLAIALLAFAWALDPPFKEPYVPVLFSLFLAVVVWLGIEQRDKRFEAVAFWAHRQAIGCRDADRWDAMGGTKDYPFRRPTLEEVERCGDASEAGGTFRAIYQARK